MRKRKWLEEPVAAPAGYGNPTSAGLVGHSAETAGFEPEGPFDPYLLSRKAHSTGLCDVSSGHQDSVFA